MRMFNKLRSFTPADYRVLLWATIMLPAVGLRLRIQGFKSVYSWAHDRSIHRIAADADGTERSIRLGRMVNIAASRGLYRASCLCRSLVLLKAMQREGLKGELKIGVGKEPRGKLPSVLNAHAWVEHAGLVVNDAEGVASTYVLFDVD